MPTINEILNTMEYGPAPESQKEAQAWLDQKGRQFGLFIDNAWSEAGELFASNNPADGKQLAQLTQASADDVDRAVQAARRAQPGWQSLGGHGRARILYTIARLMQKHARLFAVLETLDNGKTIRETRDADLPLVARHFYYHAGWAQLQDEEFANHRPVGVVGQIVPWSFPLLMLAWKIAPALAAGNTVVFKPAEFTSLSAMLFADICVQAGVPAGVVNIVTGDGRVGEAIVTHEGIDKLAFTGSTEVGRLIRQATAGSGKKLSLELGGNSPFIVFEDADLDAAVEGLVESIWFNQGQVCSAGSRLLIHESIEERFLAKVRARMDKLCLGSPLDKSMDIGAMLDPIQRKSIKGPVESMSFRTPAEAVQLANNTFYGLASSVWTENISLALDVAPQIKAGVVWINAASQFDAACGFGGYRESGYGREGGREGMYEYLVPVSEYARPAAPVLAAPAKAKAVLENAKATTDAYAIDRTARLYIGGKQARPDGAYSRAVHGADGKFLGEVGEGNRKDIRDAVEAAHKATGWTKATAHNRAQVLYYIAENLAARGEEFAARIGAMTGARNPEKEVQASIERLFYWAAWADKYDGMAHQPPMHGITVALNEAIGVIGIVAPNESPLLGLISLVAPAIAVGNRVVVVPSEAHPLSATDLYQVFDTSDLPGGVVNIVTGSADELARTLATHFDIDAVWRHDGSAEGCAEVERLSAGSLKRTWTGGAKGRDWYSTAQAGGRVVLAHASQVKNIWIPYGA
jgi:aldehyde dehydrogenase (NAD+)